ncbi:MAG: oxaloacetate decarboxylase [Parvularculaceae bacterium]
MKRLDLPSGQAILAPGVFDALSGLIAARAGARALYLSGAALAYTQLGRPDLGFLDLTRVVDAAQRITDRVETPLIVDADTGFGNALNVQRAVRAIENAGAAAIQLEDQAMPKRCGHLAGKALVPPAEMCGKIAAALDARRNTEFLIIARTDAVSVEGVDAAFDRAEAFIEVGADVLFIEALRSEEELALAGKRFAHRIPLVANMVEGGRTPILSVDQLAAIGYRLVIAPGALARASAFMAQEFFATLLRDGSSSNYMQRMLTFDEINGLLGLEELLVLGRSYDLSLVRDAAE